MKSGSGRFDFSWCKDRLDRIYGSGVILGWGQEIILDGLVTDKTSTDFFFSEGSTGLSLQDAASYNES